ncbi:ATP synthase F1 subunit delta [Blattabacterium cuenoti]|uniref:ATP synthase F1 subunit delta n=1 Tax=Blattabacterium cuenoti TaxID=1653831 RepID=UPI00163C6563|nr:ATP synthase F1 subunit delta [Blattabacterium cuenoti]
MFLKKRISKHYAQILFEYSVKIHKKNSIYKKIKKVYFLLSHNIHFNRFLKSSLLSDKNKILILEKIFYSFDFFIFHFIKLLILRKRESLLKEIILEYKSMYKKKKGIVKCFLTSSFPLNKNFQEIIVEKIMSLDLEKSEKYKKKYHIINRIDKSIVGGFLFRIGYKEWDFSVKRQLLYIQKMFKN